jgi:hypothetical protein
VIFPSKLTFNIGAPETMEITDGTCQVKIAGQDEWKTYSAGQSFSVPGNSSFEIEAQALVNYICHFG